MNRKRISDNIDAKDWACKCKYKCGQNIVKNDLVEMYESFLHYLREYFESDEIKLVIHCANRCKRHNDDLVNAGTGASPNSPHITGTAVDVHAEGITPKQLMDAATKCHTKDGILWGGLGYYPGWRNKGIHFDIGRFRSWGTPL